MRPACGAPEAPEGLPAGPGTGRGTPARWGESSQAAFKRPYAVRESSVWAKTAQPKAQAENTQVEL